MAIRLDFLLITFPPFCSRLDTFRVLLSPAGGKGTHYPKIPQQEGGSDAVLKCRVRVRPERPPIPRLEPA